MATHNEHTKVKKSYGTLRRRIQSGMFYSTALAMVILLCMLIPILYGLSIPLSSLFSNSVIRDVYTRLDTMMIETKSMSQPYPKNAPNMQELKKMSLDDLITYAGDMYHKKSEFDLMAMDYFVPKQLMVPDDSETTNKVIVASILSAFSDFERKFPVRSLINQDLLLVEYADGQNNKLLCLPIDTQKLSIAQFSEDTSKSPGFLKTFYEESKSTLTLVDSKEAVVGIITISINPMFIYGLATAVSVILGITMLLTLPIISLLIRFHARNIIKPVDQLNKQMASLATNDFYGINDFHFSVKRPPNELVTLMNSATEIMERMNDQNQELDAQKQELEAQNIELEAQNTALFESKETIQDQQDQLVRSEKMATLGQISAAIAHEINTPLGAIKSNAQMMQMVLDQTDFSAYPPADAKKLTKLRDMNAISYDASNRVTDIIKSLKNFSRVDQADFQDYDPQEGIESVLVLTSNLWKNHVNIVKEYGSAVHVQGYAGLLNQVIMNIVVNAIHAMPNGGSLTIATQADSQYYSMSFRDTGTGIQAGNLEKIFESGFTTKDASMGTGLGLAISKGIVDKHSGTISAYNNEGDVGATFVVKLPLAPLQ